jgi:uncharacterized membrane protein YjgN (DUF898 family)
MQSDASKAGGAEPEVPIERALSFRFTGTAQEYFRIWIVNTLLTIVTLGIYSAWAKVRSRQYFYRNTWLDDSSFEYLADPIKVLKGRLIAALTLVGLAAPAVARRRRLVGVAGVLAVGTLALLATKGM